MVLEKPQANLLNEQGEIIGSHYEGPTWEATDGSKVSGEVQQRAKAARGDAIPWLLLTASGHSGSGILSRVTTIQRIHTKGGQPPAAAGCDDSHRGDESRSAYTADYYFYAPAH